MAEQSETVPKRAAVDMTPFPPSGYIRDGSLVSWMWSLPPTPKPYTWSNEATTLFVLALCEARRAGLITSARMDVINKQGRLPIWQYIRQRFCECGLYALAPGLTDSVLEYKYKTEMDTTFKPYKKLVGMKYSGTGFEMNALGRFEASDELWERHLSMKGNSKDGWLRTRGMPLWAQYEEAFGEDVATGDLAQLGKRRQREAAMKYVAQISDINHDVGPQHNVPQRREQQESVIGPQTPEMGTTPAKRRRETSIVSVERQTRMTETLQEIGRLTSELNKSEDQQLRAYETIKELNLGRRMEREINRLLENTLNVVDVLKMKEDGDEQGLSDWCMEMVHKV